MLKIVVLEGEMDLVSRVEACLVGEEVQILRGHSSLSPFFEPGVRPDGAIISTSVLLDDVFSPADWELAQGVPVLWVGTRQPTARWLEGKKPQILPPNFTCAQLRARLASLLVWEKEEPKPQAPKAGEIEIIYRSTAMRELLGEVRAYAVIDSSVLIRGETGTGKELIARMIAQGHPKYGSGPFVAVNCGAIPENLFESLFFGHVKGAFTGAWRNHSGYLAEARGGTLYLDEIGDLPSFQQVKLLRALEEGVITPVGAKEPIHVDFRLVAATNRPLRKMIQDDRFRSDLYYRIAVIELQIPNLEERGPEDKITLFAHGFAEAMQRFQGTMGPEIPGWLQDMVAARIYRGNVRELLNLATRLAALYTVSGSWPRERCRTIFANPPEEGGRPEAWTAGEREERRRIVTLLNENGWRRAETAAAMGISRKTLWEKMRKYGVWPLGLARENEE